MNPARGKRTPFRFRPRRPSPKQGGSRSGKLIRRPAVAGVLYPDERGPLEAQVDRWVERGAKPEPAAATLVPHGSYASCGAVIGAVCARISWPETVVLVGPNHTGEGQPYGIAARGAWQTPLGELPVDEELARAILRRAKELKRDAHCHAREHALELLLPFLQRSRKVRRIVPIAIAPADIGPAQRIGEAVAEEILRRRGEVHLVGSVNLTRYEPLEAAQAKDPAALERILALDGSGLAELASERPLSMCGVGAAAAVMAAARRLGASKGRLVRYQTTAETGGEALSVAGFAGIVFQ